MRALRTRPARAIAVCGLLFALVRCGERAERASISPDRSTLRVEAHLPEGDTPPRASVDVVFDRPMARLGDRAPTDSEGRRYLDLDPRPSGSYRWIGTRTLSYVVAGGLPPATSFAARVPQGAKALDGTRLAHEVRWTFTTPRPALVASVPASRDSLARPGEPIVLLFNLPVDPPAAARAASIEGVASFAAGRADSALLRELDPVFWNADSTRIVTLTPEPALERDHPYVFRLAETLQARDGKLGPEAPIEIPFRTHGLPRLLDVTADGGAVMRLTFTTPVDPDSVRAYIVFEPQPNIESAFTNQTLVFFTGEFGFEKTYRVTVRRGMPDLFGQRTTEDAVREVRTGIRESTLQLLPTEAVLLPTTPRTVALVASNMHPVRVRAARLGVREEILQRERPMGGPRRWTLDRTVQTPDKPGTLVTQTIDLKSLLPSSGRGAVIVEATTRERTAQNEGGEWSSRSVLRWSDLGVTLKVSPENGLAWVTSLSTGKPVSRAALQILDEKAKQHWSGTTDAHGMARIPGTRELGREAWQLTFVAAVRGDTATSSFLPDWRLAPWRFDLPGDYGMEGTPERAFLYTDRDLYRPGETVRLAGFVRRFTSDGLMAAAIDSIELRLRDPLGREAVVRRADVDLQGGFAFDWRSPGGAPTGRWWIEAGLPTREPSRRRQTIGSTGIELSAFRAAPFRTSVRAEKAHLFAGDALATQITSSYYFGAPLARAAFTWNAVRERIAFRPRGFDTFSFADEEIDAAWNGALGSGTGTLDAAGQAAVRIALPPDLPAATQAIRLEATVRDAAGDAVSGRATALYHPAPVYAGVAVSPTFVPQGGEVKAQVVAVRADTALVAPGTPVEIELVRRDWRAARKLLVGGRVGFETTPVDSVVETRQVVAAAEPLDLRFAPPSSGSYRLRVRAKSNGITSPPGAMWFWVAGARPGAWRPEDAVRLELKADKKRYKPGDVARFLVTTPVQAPQALLTIEREGLIESRLVVLDPASQVVEVEVRPEYLPNVYVGLAAAERALTAHEAPGLPEPARLPRFVAGYAPLAVEVDSRRLALEVRADRAEYRPGDRARVALEVRNAAGQGVEARVGIAVVDEAVLALLGSPIPDPFEFFYRERPLSVQSRDTRLRLSAGSRLEAAKFKGEAGGDGAAALATRSLFTTTAYWNPAVLTDASGRGTVEFELPDNTTTFRIVAVASSGVERFGNGRGDFRVTKPLVVEPALPRFTVDGDTVELAAVVTNRSAQELRGPVRIDTDLQLLARPETEVTVPAGTSRRVVFRARVARTEPARVRFEARLPGASDAVELQLPVVRAEVPKQAASAGIARGTVTESIALPAAALPGSGRLEIDLAASALAGARPAIDYVAEYPYGCLEQLASRVLALVAARRLFAENAADSTQLAVRIASAIDGIEKQATNWGSFAFWPGGSEAPAWLGAYATFALGRAARDGFEVSPEVLENAKYATLRAWREGSLGPDRRRRDAVTTPMPTEPETRRVPSGLALLALSELVRPEPGSVLQPADVDVLADAVDRAPLDERMFLALAFDRWDMRPDVVEKILRTALGRVEVTATGAVVPPADMNDLPPPFRTTARATSLALWLATRVRPTEDLVPKLANGLLSMRAQGHWGTTQDDALSLLALESYRDAVEAQGGMVEGSARLGATPLATLAAPAGSLKIERAATSVSAPATSNDAVPLALHATGALHYAAVLRWREPLQKQSADDTGFTLVRRLEPFEGKGPAKLGDLMVVTLEIVVPRESWYLALVDPLPAGLEIVQPQFRTESQAATRQLDEKRSAHERFPVTHVERLDRELRLFADYVAAGVYEHRTLVRVRAAGGFAHPPARLEAMYEPELHAATAAARFRAQGP